MEALIQLYLYWRQKKYIYTTHLYISFAAYPVTLLINYKLDLN